MRQRTIFRFEAMAALIPITESIALVKARIAELDREIELVLVLIKNGGWCPNLTVEHCSTRGTIGNEAGHREGGRP